MSKRTLTILGWLCLFGAVILVVLSFATKPTKPQETPRTDTPSAEPTPSADKEDETAPAKEDPLVIEGSDILSISIPRLSLTVPVSGSTEPRQTPNCKGGAALCIDPPVVAEAAWYGVTPAVPATGTVRLFGHTSYIDGLSAAFDSLPKVKNGDTITLTTINGVFCIHSKRPSTGSVYRCTAE